MAVSRLTSVTLGTDSRTCSPTISRRLAAARLTPILTISVRASSSSSLRMVAHRAASRQALGCVGRKSPIAFSVSGFCRKVAPTSRARVTTSTWWLAEMTASGTPGLSAQQLGREVKAVAARHVEVEDRQVEGVRSKPAPGPRRHWPPRSGSSPAGARQTPWRRPCAQACCRRRPEPCNPYSRCSPSLRQLFNTIR